VNLLSVIYPHLELDHLSASERDALLHDLIDHERRYLAVNGPSFYTVILAEPLRGAA
jgi:hypothetical protein